MQGHNQAIRRVPETKLAAKAENKLRELTLHARRLLVAPGRKGRHHRGAKGSGRLVLNLLLHRKQTRLQLGLMLQVLRCQPLEQSLHLRARPQPKDLRHPVQTQGHPPNL